MPPEMSTDHVPASSRGSAYRPEIDGLRACAVVPVVLFHAGGNWLPGGFVGVDVFFVISGYLITGILLRDIHAGRFAFREFMTRRVLRILPAFLTMIAVTLAVTRCFVFRPDQQEIGRQSTAAILSVANIKFWLMEGDYWGADAAESPLLHTWSLSVEEQFYLCVPFLLCMLVRFAPRHVRGAILASTIASFGLFLAGIASHRDSATFYLLPTRAWELGVGSCLAAFAPAATAAPRLRGVWRDVAALAGLGLIFASMVFCRRLDWSVSIAVAGTALVLAFADGGWSRFLLTLRPLVWVGLASYSIYLWHQPVFVLSDTIGPFARRRWLVPLVFAIGAVSYLLVERHSRHDRRLLPLIALSYVSVLAFALLIQSQPRGYDTSSFARVESSAGLFDLRDNSTQSPAPRAGAPLGVDMHTRASRPDEFRDGGWKLGTGDTPRIVVLGDSHACMWSAVVRDVITRQRIPTSFYCASGDRPFIDAPYKTRYAPFSESDTRAFDEARKAFIARWKPDLVILAARWSSYEPEHASALLDFLDTHAKHVLLVEQPPELTIGRKSALQWLPYRSVLPQDGVRQFLPAGHVSNYGQGRAAVRTLAREHANCSVLFTSDIYSGADGTEVLVLDGRDVVYLDEDHLTDYGVNLAAGRFDEAITRLVPAR